MRSPVAEQYQIQIEPHIKKLLGRMGYISAGTQSALAGAPPVFVKEIDGCFAKLSRQGCFMDLVGGAIAPSENKWTLEIIPKNPPPGVPRASVKVEAIAESWLKQTVSSYEEQAKLAMNVLRSV